jgi:hypothetical protein
LKSHAYAGCGRRPHGRRLPRAPSPWGTSVATVGVVVPRNSMPKSARRLKNSVTRPRSRTIRCQDRLQGGPDSCRPRGLPGRRSPRSAGRRRRQLRVTTRVRRRVLTVTGTKDDRPARLVHGDRPRRVERDRPEQRTDKLLVFFNAESACYGGAGLPGPDHRRRQRDRPVQDKDSAFDSVRPPARWTARPSAHRARQPDAERRRAQVWWQILTSASTKFRYDDWTLAAQRIRVT